MKKAIATIMICVFLFASCGMSQYQLEAEKAYYQTMAVSSMKAQPLVEIAPADAGKPLVLENLGKLTVFAPPQNQGRLQQYVQKDYNAGFWNFLTTGLSILAPVWGATQLVKYAVNGAGTTTNASVSGEGNILNYGSIDNTSPPTVVTQPAPIIVQQPAPVIVNPVIVE